MSADTVMITYEPPLAAADGTNEQLAARGEHLLLFSAAAKSSAEKMMRLQYKEGSKVPWQVVGQMVGPFVEFDGPIGDCVAFGYYPTAQMLDRIFRCRVGLRAEGGTEAAYALSARRRTRRCARPRPASAPGCGSAPATSRRSRPTRPSSFPQVGLLARRRTTPSSSTTPR